MRRTIVTSDPDATEAFAEALGRALEAGSVVTLDGDLGSGKTTFVRGLARGLGLERGVASPTYTLMQAHEGGRLPLYHFDAWMEGREKALLADGADEFLGRDGVAVVEWADQVADWLPAPRLSVRLAHRSPEERAIDLSVVGEGGEALADLVKAVPLPPGAREGDALR
ncbi:MAG: tRNA (adenosine(37)-N6)-threonylcarbamoyltransferase complex ATPase subunit type 1 TsaE [Planctomycetota bacterium]